MSNTELMQEQLRLLEEKVFVQIIYERGSWHYLLHELPSDEDVEFAKNGGCQDGDLWLDSQAINQFSYIDQDQKTFLGALGDGINEAQKWLKSRKP